MRTKHLSSVLVLAVSSGAAAAAHAATDAEQPAAAVNKTPAPSVTSNDPNIDRGFLLPTAMTQPAGSITYNNYELLLHGITYGLTDRIQATLTVLSPITSDMPFVGFAAVKGRLVSTERFHLALQGSGGFAHQFSTSSSNAHSVYSLGAGAFATLCLRDDCSSLMSASATYQRGFADASNSSLGVLVYGGSIVHGVSRHIKLLGEVASAAGHVSDGADSSSLDNVSGALVSYGVRFHTDDIAGDVGFVKPFVSNDNTRFLMGFPFVSLSYRWN